MAVQMSAVGQILIPDDAYPYLVAQRGAIDDMRDDPELWANRYAAQIYGELDLIEPYLPKNCESILDIGSGLGGINALINRYYGGDCRVTLVDGVKDKAEVELHRQTFNDMGVARRFLEANGVRYFSHIDANDPNRIAAIKYDLIVSFKSWCFHIEPAEHLELVRSACREGTTLIIDVRRGNVGWAKQLASEFHLVDEIFHGPKTITCVYRYV